MNKLQKIQVRIIFSILFATLIPAQSFAQENTVNAPQDSFPKNIHYLATAYLDGMQHMTSQTINDMTHMTESLSVSIAIMLDDNKRTIHRSTAQLNREIVTQLLPEMKALGEKVLLMNHQVASQFSPRSAY